MADSRVVTLPTDEVARIAPVRRLIAAIAQARSWFPSFGAMTAGRG
ncbi:hypothetical protein J2792_003811 [Novosphingobium capsulatum]|uniref:Uncharacterized protein n=1 Tax=Novosphingobium capsulatum TaxID=13688 RepID=A0ABU1MRZ1_9SPHN|nr:hypothetical protein [Novosphingobium capsulatum]PUA99822.1 hypothetical protein C8K12_11715 [Novosphingobium sp. GV061]PUB38886.1 hypothetical protein C8K10_11715 [Novosphingobium sp. GV027]